MNKEEIIIDVKLVSKIQILATAINSSLFAKAISDINMDMVKPMLHTIDDKKIEVQFKSEGFFVIFKRLLKNVKIIIPKGLPTSRPKYIPRNTDGKLVKFKLLLMFIPVLAKANKGMIIKLFIERKFLCI